MGSDSSPLPIPPDLEAVLLATGLGQPCYYFGAIDSTNAWLREPAQADLPAGALVVADYQSQGKGRLGRRWEAPPGSGLLMSLLVRPDWPVSQAVWLTMLAGLAAVAAVQEAIGPRRRAGLKWPNDVMLADAHGRWRKCGGILVETTLDHARISMAVIGIGLNVTLSAEQLPPAITPATSLLIETGQTISRWALLGDLLRHWQTSYAAAQGGLSPQPVWNQRLITLGQAVTVTYAAGETAPLRGVAETTDAWGGLIVRDAQGQRQTVNAGDVTLYDPASS